MSSMLQKGERAKYIDFPSAVYAMHPFDMVLADGRMAGLSTWIGYSANEGRMLALAMMDEAFSTPGQQVTLLWGEPGGGTRKPTVEPHVQVEIRATVSPAPYSEVARDSYADGWRTHQPG
jgi:glycine cleavage system aminomethyltransferase T